MIRTTKTMARLAGALGLAVAAGPALAHTGAGAVHGFGAGFTHPLLGLDHVLAMVAVGLWAGVAGGRARWAYPLAFVSVMVLAGAAGMAGLALPGVETGIAVSLVVLGAAGAANLVPPVAAGALACGAFAIFHGYAHGAELPEDAGAVAYAAGFVIATAALHGAGLALATAFASRAPLLTRLAGGGIALAGLALLAG